MTSKAKFAALWLASMVTATAYAGPRVGHFEEIQIKDASGEGYVGLRAPAGLTTWNMTLPPNDGATDQVLTSDGNGVLTWTGPKAASGANTDITSLKVDAASGSSGGYASTADNDTNITFPSDGLIRVHANNVVSAEFNPNGINVIRGVDYVWPNAQASGTKVLTNDGAGNLTWDVGGGGVLAISDTYTATGSSSRNDVYTNYAPTAGADNMTTLIVHSNVTTDHDVNSVTGLRLVNNTQQTGNVGETAGIYSTQSIGNDTAPTNTTRARGMYFNHILGNQATLGSDDFLNYDLYAPAGSNIDDSRSFRVNLNVDNFTNGYSLFESQGSVNHIAQNMYGFWQRTDVTDAQNGIFPFGVGGHWTSVANNSVGYAFSPQIDSFSGLNFIQLNPQLGSQTGNNNFVTGVDIGPTSTLLGSYYPLSIHDSGVDVTDDLRSININGNYTGSIGRNAGVLSAYRELNEVKGYYNGIEDNTTIDNVVYGDVTGFRSNVKATSVPGDMTGMSINVQGGQRGLTQHIATVQAQADVADSLAGKYWHLCSAYSENPSECFRVWYKVSGNGTAPTGNGDTMVEVDISTNDTAADVGIATSAAVDALLKFTATDDGNGLVTVTVVATGRGGNLDAGNGDGNGVNWVSNVVQGGGGDGNATGLRISMYGLTGYDEAHTVAIDTGGGRVQFGQLQANKDAPVSASPGNPVITHNISSNLSAGDNLTIIDADSIGIGSFGNLRVGDNTTITSGGLGVGTVASGKIALVNIGAGSSVQSSGSDLQVVALTAGSGELKNAHGTRALAINFGASTPITNYRAFFADSLGAAPATNSWGLYANPDYAYNYMGGALKIGGAADGTNDKITSANAGLEIDSKHIRVMGTSPTTKVDANAGIGATCSVSAATDTAGVVELTTTAVLPASGPQCSVDFAASFGTAPVCVFSPMNAAAAQAASLVFPFFDASTTAMSVNFSTGHAVGDTYLWAYHCIETN